MYLSLSENFAKDLEMFARWVENLVIRRCVCAALWGLSIWWVISGEL